MTRWPYDMILLKSECEGLSTWNLVYRFFLCKKSIWDGNTSQKWLGDPLTWHGHDMILLKSECEGLSTWNFVNRVILRWNVDLDWVHTSKLNGWPSDMTYMTWHLAETWMRGSINIKLCLQGYFKVKYLSGLGAHLKVEWVTLWHDTWHDFWLKSESEGLSTYNLMGDPWHDMKAKSI